MKIKTNVRAGAGKQKRSSSTDSSSSSSDVVYIPPVTPVSRCAGI